ncbi:MAG: aminotransferase class III-fold pyridoxal phosphate-dependent enzyme [Candidatus Nanopelagicales bacterium]
MDSIILAGVDEHFADFVGSDARTDSLPGERDLNIKITSGGATMVLKVYADDDREWLELQDRALRHLSGTGLRTPEPLHREIVALSDGRVMRLVSWLDGAPWSAIDPSPAQTEALGALVARVDRLLCDFDVTVDEAAVLQRPFRWNMMQALDLRRSLSAISDADVREACERTFDEFEQRALPILATLATQPIHNDANENNIIVDDDGLGLIDFGDLVLAPRIVGLATAVAYAIATSDDPVRAAVPIVRGYHLQWPLTPIELDVLWVLVRMRLVMSVVNAAEQSAADPDNAYLLISQDVVPRLLVELDRASDYLALSRIREACGYDPSPRARDVRHHLRTAPAHPVLDLAARRSAWIDWSTGSCDPRDSAGVAALMDGLDVLAGHYAEDRDVYRGDTFEGEQRTVHLGLDLFQPAGSSVFAPYDGVVEVVQARPDAGDYGHVVILRHATDAGTPFWTLYGHLGPSVLDDLEPGASVSAGDRIGALGEEHVNGAWPPHVHVQVLTDLCGMDGEIYGVAPRTETTLWRSLCPNPNLMVGIPPGETASDAHPTLGREGIAEQRRVRLSRNLSLNFREPLHIVRGEGAYLFDAQGNAYLDLVNNVAHVGHATPFVNAAATRQMATLNTNTRFLHDAIIEYARSLTATLPDPLSVAFFVNSGSEANDLAIRLARAHTGAQGWISLRHAYHGHTVSVVDISPYKFLGRGGEGARDHVRVAELPDAYRGAHTGPGAGAAYADDFARTLATLDEPLAAFISEGIVSTAGQVTLAEGFLADAYRQTRAAGGVCIADEVQIGLGRVGERFWGFELHDVVPDIVTMGKPLGNGHPLAAVVTTPEIAESFHNGMEYFNTFGGNPVSATIGQCVLDYVLDNRLQAHADTLGSYVQDQVRGMRSRHPLIGDVRGHGLFLGIELLRDGEPATYEVAGIIEYALGRGVMLSSDGPANNVFKIKPPLVVQREDMDHFLDVLDQALHQVR